MDFSIRSNQSELWGSSALNRNLQDVFMALSMLSSGRRINTASDDPAGMSISTQLRSQIASLDQEIRNYNLNLGKVRTASSRVSEMQGMLTELRSLAVGAANAGGNDESTQQAYVSQAEDIMTTYNYSLGAASYNGAKLFDGSPVSVAELSSLSGIDLSTADSAVASIESIDSAMNKLNSVAVDLGSQQRNGLQVQLAMKEIERENLIAAESSIGDSDYATAVSIYVARSISARAAVALLGHSLMNGKDVMRLFEP